MHLCDVNLSVELYKVTANKCNKNHSMGVFFQGNYTTGKYSPFHNLDVYRQAHRSAILTQFIYSKPIIILTLN
jgi:hypothetical protein